jgi:hypothetical protein
VAGVTPTPPAITVRIATAIVLLETVAAWGYIGYLTVDAIGEPGGWRVVGYFALYAVAFTLLSVGLWRRRKWVRAPLIVLQLLLSVTGFSMVYGDAPVVGVLLILLAVGCAGLLLVEQTRTALG